MSAPTSSAAVARVIRTARMRAGLPITRVARESGLTPSELTSIETGRVRPSIAALDRIARALGSSLVKLMRSSGEDASGQPAARSQGKLGLHEIARAIAELPSNGGSKIDAAESATILYAMRACNDNQSAAARLLSMERKAFVRRLIRARRKPRRN